MAPRALWSGTISFGLVTVPVRLFPAVAEHKLHFHLVHETDDGPIGYQKVCKLEDRAVPDDEVVKAFEVRKGELVRMEDADFELAGASGAGRVIEILDFVPLADIDPLNFAKAYYVGPGAGGDHVYALLARAMADSGLAAVATFVMRDRRHLGALRVAESVIVLEQLHFADELRPPEDVAPSAQRVSKQELEMAARLIASYKSAWRPETYKDTYRDELLALIKAKKAGKAPKAPEPEPEEPADLMEALRQSIRSAGSAGEKRTSAGGGSSNGRTRKRTAR
jgi:DNA end-binding protein Ku